MVEKEKPPSLGAPALRIGHVITATESEKGVQVEYVTRSVSDARKLGLQIVKRDTQYLHSQKKSVESFFTLAEASETLGDLSSIDIKRMKDGKDDYTKARFSPGLIIDFPALCVATEKYEIECRICLTVCLNETRSKVWARFVMRSVKGSDSFDLKEENINDFHSACQKLSEKVITATSELYQQDFERFRKKSINFNKVATLEFFTVDGEGSGIEADLAMTSDLIEVGLLSEKIDNPLVAKLMRVATRSGHKKLQDRTKSPDFKLSEDAHFVVEEASDGTPAIFIGYADEDSAYFTGVASRATDEKTIAIAEENQIVTFSNGLAAVSRLATRVAKHF